MLKDQLELLTKEFNTLKEKLRKKLTENQQTLNESNRKLNESNRKLELALKENSEHEKVLAQLLKEMKELGEEL